MNGFKLMADSYRKLLVEEKIDKQSAEKEIRIYDFLATCDKEDFSIMINSSAFNDFIRDYLKLAVKNAKLNKKSTERVINELRYILD